MASEDTISVAGPDGVEHLFPSDATDAEILEFFKRNTPKPVSTMEAVGRGVLDPINAGAQLLEKSLPEAITKPVNKLNNFLAQYGVVAPVGEKGVAEDIANQEKTYQERRKAAGQEGVDWARMGGNLVSPANVGVGMAAAPLKLAGRLVTAGAQGLLAAPTESTDNFAGQKVTQGGLGVLGGGAGELGSKVLRSVVSPAASTDAGIQQLIGEGITPTIGHMVGPRATSVERALQITPLLGTAINKAENRTYDDFNRAVANRVLRNVDETIPKDVPVGTDLFAHVDKTLSDKYNALLPKMKGEIDPKLQSDLDTIKSMSQAMPKDQADTFNRILQDKLTNRFTEAGKASGETLKVAESELGREAKNYLRDPSYDNRKIGEGLREAQSALRDMIVRQNPDHAEELSKLNNAWAAATRMEQATAKASKNGGVFTPDEYIAAVKGADQSLRKRNTAKGTALDQDFATVAQRVLGSGPSRIGSQYRTAAALGFGGAYMANPMVLGGEIAASVPYSPVGQKLGALAMAHRPAGAEKISDLIRQGTPLTYPATAGALNALREKNK